MFKKQLEHMMMVSLNYFFNFDYSFCKEIFFITLVISALIKLYFVATVDYVHRGMVNLKNDFAADAASIKSVILEYKEILE